MRASLYPQGSALVLWSHPELRYNLGERGEGKSWTAQEWMINGHRADLEVSESSVPENIFVLKWPFLHMLVAQSHTHFTYERLTWVDQLLSNQIQEAVSKFQDYRGKEKDLRKEVMLFSVMYCSLLHGYLTCQYLHLWHRSWQFMPPEPNPNCCLPVLLQLANLNCFNIFKWL